MKKMILTALLLSTALFLTIGCGKKESPESLSAGSADGQTQASSSGTPAGEAGQTLAKVPALTQGDPLFVTKYIPLTLNFPNSDNYGKLIRTDSYGSRLYLLTACKDLSDEADIWQYALYLFDGDTQQLKELPFTLSLPGREAYSVKSMELVNDSELSFRLSEPKGEDYHDFLVTTDLEGNLLSLEEDFPDRESYPWNPDFRENRIVFDSPDGSTIFCEWDADNESSSLFRFDRDTNGSRLFGSLDGEFISALCLSEGNILYYIANERLYRWNMADDTRQELIRLSDSNIPTLTTDPALFLNSSGDVLVCCPTEKNPGVYVLSDEAPRAEDEIRLACLYDDVSRYSVKAASSYSSVHPECPIKMEKSTEEASRDRIFMELASGDGPELLWLSKEDMKLLAEKDVLMDLSELIPPAIYEQLFPCVIQDCTIDGHMVGISPGFDLISMAVPNTVWAEDSWTLSDMLTTAESRDDWELLLGNPYKLDGYRLFFNLLPCLSGTPFLDLEQGQAHFDHEDFRRLLEICLQYGGRTRSPGEDIYMGDETVNRLIHEGNCMAQLFYVNWGLQDFSAALAGYGDEIHLTGYPSYGDSGHYTGNAYGYLAVNKEAEHLEEITDYISQLLDYDRQFIAEKCCARMDVARDKVKEESYLGTPVLLIRGPSDELIQQPLELKPDGTTYLEEYMAILESAVPLPEDPSRISAILEEELGAYFSETKSLEDTIDVIQNRVQLYLDERAGG
ncbi:MAG TPA: hypothetical protein DCZ91_10805 [Lachnospiraceae bacterium]|nr:hypothetical protein [Lachnospiraceae bacterium]